MIVGVTHGEDGTIHKITKYRGKISTGFAAGEGTNKSNHPVPAGFFRLLRETITNQRTAGGQVIATKQWVINTVAQEKLQEVNNKSSDPRRLEFVCLYQTAEEFWESSLAMYGQSEGLLCKSHGMGTNARQLQYNDKGERSWIDRMFDGKVGCTFEKCPDYISKLCKPIGLMKIFPVVDMAPNPYRFETRSINTILGIESSLSDLSSLLKAAHAVKQIEAGKALPFDGFFGQRLIMWHHKVKSGGRDVYITDVLPTADFTKFVMEPIKRGIAHNISTAGLTGGSGQINLLTAQGQPQLADAEEVVPMELDDQRSIAANFGADADAIDGVVEDAIPPENDGPPTDKNAALDAVDRLAEKAAKKK
jgi:hypothetical protein